ncbi:SDR family oxidoreductase [Cypionkella sp.]|uniref:SDR family NAD(P)-dependent oxidoreductase n=1 Tax=Cypionkella sp. TaxID=2811411 RepID=UPI002AB9927D|nr:SDR family oxidoreductase [Cypionkella sp.]MDZ4394453.1 SDR family oxidoreductase [Cypionkella sp.]
MTEASCYQHRPYAPFQTLLDLRGQIAVVTGGSLGIGEAVSRRLLEAGATVVVASIMEGALDALQADFGPVHYRHCDVTRPHDIDALFDWIEAEFGRLDILVNNAGIYPLCATDDVTPDFFDRIIAVNLKGSFFTTQRAMRLMRAAGNGGAVVNLSSICGHKPMPNHCVYDSTKGAVLAMTRNLARSGAVSGIRVNSISPGLTATPGNLAPELFRQLSESGVLQNIPLRRAGEPSEIANAILFLVSPMASYMTGADLLVDGGWSLHGI